MKLVSTTDPSNEGFTVVVLAGQRAGVVNKVAEAHGVSHKCLVLLDGRPLIAWVLDVAAALPGVRRIVVSVEPDIFDALRPYLATYRDGLIELVPSRTTIPDSIVAAVEGAETPYIITTADNVLLTAEPVEQTLALLEAGADVVGTLVTREAVLAAHPEGARRFYHFKDAAYANCNLYGIAGSHAFEALRIFREGGQFMNNPQRLVRAFGLFNIMLMRWKMLTLDAAMRRLSRRFGLRFEALRPADGAQAIDVDSLWAYDIAEHLLRKRRTQTGA